MLFKAMELQALTAIKGEWIELRRTPKLIQEIDTLIVGDSLNLAGCRLQIPLESNVFAVQKWKTVHLKSILVATDVIKLLLFILVPII